MVVFDKLTGLMDPGDVTGEQHQQITHLLAVLWVAGGCPCKAIYVEVKVCLQLTATSSV